MGNASPEVQRTARYVTTSNEEEGFANAVERVRAGRGPRTRAGDAGAAVRDARLPVRSRRRPHADRRGCTPRRGSRCSTTSCAQRAAAAGEPLRPLRRRRTTTTSYVDGKLRVDGARAVPRLARHRAARTTPTVREPRPSARTSSCSSCCASGRSRPTTARCATCDAARDAGLRTAVVSSSKHTAEVLRLRRASPTCSTRASTASSPRRSTSPASRRPTPSSRPRARSASRPTRRSCSRTRSPASRPGGRATSATSSASTASGQAAELRRHGADVVVHDLAALLEAA